MRLPIRAASVAESGLSFHLSDALVADPLDAFHAPVVNEVEERGPSQDKPPTRLGRKDCCRERRHAGVEEVSFSKVTIESDKQLRLPKRSKVSARKAPPGNAANSPRTRKQSLPQRVPVLLVERCLQEKALGQVRSRAADNSCRNAQDTPGLVAALAIFRSTLLFQKTSGS